MGKFNKVEKSWMTYDLAVSAYSLIITTAIFPIYFKAVATNAGVDNAASTAFFSYSVSIATFILAMLGPILGAIADYKGMKKKFFTFFVSLGVLSVASFVLIPGDLWIFLLFLYVLAAIGSNGAELYYNAFLVDVTKEEKFNEVSSRGFALGYIGSVIPFIVCIAIIMLSQNGVLPFDSGGASKIAFFITALWWGGFTLPLLKNVKQIHYVQREPRVVVNSFKRLAKTFKEIRKYRMIFIFG